MQPSNKHKYTIMNHSSDMHYNWINTSRCKHNNLNYSYHGYGYKHNNVNYSYHGYVSQYIQKYIILNNQQIWKIL